MDHFEARNYNGMDRGEDDDDRGEKKRNYKLTADPLLKSGPQKVYRFDGYNPSDPMPIIPRDPRSRMKRFWTKRDALHLPVPKFKYDQYYVGTILPKEVTFTNLNDNINKQFLKDMCFRFGNIEDCMIFYHPTTKKHMGMGKVLFTSTRAARNCVNKLDSTTKMGNVMTVFLDSMGKERQRLIEEMTGEKQARHHHHHHQKTSPSSSKGNRKSSHGREPSTPRQPQAPVTPTPRSNETFNTPSSQEVSTPNSAPVPLTNGPAGFLSPPEIPAFMPPVVPPPGKPPPAFTMPPPPIGPHLGPPPEIPPFPPPIDTSQPPPPLPPTHFPPPPPHEAFNQFVPNMSCPPPTHLGMQPGMPQPPVVIPSVQSGSSQVREEQHTPQHYNSRTANQPDKTSNNRSYRDNGHRKDSHRDGEGGEWRNVEEGEEEDEEGGRWYKESRGGSRSWERDRHRDRYKDRYYDDDEEENDRDSYDRDDRHRHRKHRRHKHRKDRHRDRHRDRDRRDHHRRHSQEEEEKRIDNEPVVNEWQSSPAPPPKVEEEAPPPKADSPEPERHMSLESRIQSLLGVSLGASFGSGEEESGSAAETIDTTQVDSTGDQPPLPVEDDPPLPPVEDEPPPLPPEPAPHENITDVHPPVEMAGSEVLVGFDSGTVAANHTPWMGVVEVPSGQIETVEMENNADDDDRMSLSSLSSGDEKLEVMQVPSASAAYTQYMTNYHNNSLMQNAGMGVHCAHMYQQHFQMDNEQARIHQLQQSLDPHDEEAEKSFLAVLEQVITELKFVMRKDLQKKMVETSAFKSLETWWDSEDSREKTVKLSPLKSPPLMPGMKQPGFLAKPQDTRLAPSPPPKKETKDMSETLASLFDHKDDSMGGFGMGGLLGIRGGIPKLPSFRRPKFRPATPPEDEGHDRKDEESDEDEEKGYKGPCTPEDSGNEAKGDSSESEGVSDSEEDDRLERARKPLIGSDESDWDSEKPDESEADSESAASSSSSLEEDSDEATDESDAESDAASSSSVVSSDDEAAVSRPRSVSRDSRSSSRSSSASELSVADRDKESGASLSQEESRSKAASPSLSVGGSSLADVSDTESILDRAESVDMKEAESDKSSAEEGEITEDDEESQEAATAAREPDDDALMDVDEAEILGEADEEEKSAAVAGHKVEEEDAAMALLEMQSPTQRLAEAPPPPSEPSQADLEAAQVAREAALAAEAKRNELSSMQAEHNYFAPPVDSQTKSKERAASDETDSASEGEPQLIATLPVDLALDHSYCQPYFPVDTPTYPEDKEPPGWMDQTKGQVPILEDVTENLETVAAEVEVKAKEKAAKAAIKRPRGNRKLTDVTNLDVPRELANLLPPPVVPPPVIQFKARSLQEEMQVTYEFLFKGIDQEDVEFIKQRYEELLQDDGQQTYWLNDTHWVDHSHTRIPDPVPPKKRRKYSSHEEVVVAHKTGCARTEGYYKISHQEKYGYLKDFCGVLTDKEGEIKVWESTKKKIQISREARSESRRWQNVLQSMGEDVGDLFKFNQLKFRKKNLKFAKSGIHDWGLFALEPIAEGEMVIEYVGAVVRQSVADIREKKYEAMGIGSSYMFRIDHETIIDATKCGNLARFINHSCNPNCVAKIITVEGQKKIVIYSKRDIDMNEEITYDYKFPIEDEKISCMCGESSCRGTLN